MMYLGFRSEVDEGLALLGCDAGNSGNFVPGSGCLVTQVAV
jgi:hypothetical protein